MEHPGTDPKVRMAVLAERVDARKAIWTEDEATYHGHYVNFDRVWSWPKPSQRPYPPILVGGHGPTVLDRVIAFGDAWFPNYGPADLLDRIRQLQGRADRPIEVQVMGVPADPLALAELAEAGVRRVVHWVPSATRGPIERSLDRFEAAVSELHGE